MLTILSMEKKGKAVVKCDCGVVKTVRYSAIGRSTFSCGCKKKSHGVKHGGARHPLYRVYYGMKQRCYNPQSEKVAKIYKNKGITVCDAWLSDYGKFYQWALANGYKKGLTIDRIDSSKGYSPENCRIVDYTTQNYNRSNTRYLTLNGVKKLAKDWAQELGVLPIVIYNRISKGWSDEKILKTPYNPITTNYLMKEF